MEQISEKIQKNKEELRLYQPKEVSEITGINKELLTKYTNHFNIQTEWTQPNNRGHRRYTKENIEQLKAIKSKISDNGWSWKQVTSWLNGEEALFIKKESKSNLEKKQDLMLEEIKMLREYQEKQQQMFQLIIDKMSENHQTEMLKLQNYINKPKEKKKGFLSKIFRN